MDRQKLINEIRGLQKTKAKFSLDDVETEIRKRKTSPYNKIADYDELPDDNDNAISEYLASPKFRQRIIPDKREEIKSKESKKELDIFNIVSGFEKTKILTKEKK